MPNPKISLILAVYNIRDYIGECIKSCLNQEGVSKNDYEIIVVNDGSTDDSLDVASKFIAGHENTILLNKQNGGLSDARNYGLKHSKGEYIWFVDGDDLISNKAIKTIIDAMSSKAQVYMFDFNELYSDNSTKYISFNNRLPNKLFDGYKLVSEDKIAFPPMMAWLQVQKRSFIIENKLEFLKGAKSEDIEYTAKLFSVATRIYYIPKSLYFYRKNREGSIFTGLNNNTKWINNLLNIYSSVEKYLNNRNINSKYCNRVLSVISTFILYNLYSQDRETFIKSCDLIKKRNINFEKVLLKRRRFKSLVKWASYNCLPYFISKRILGRY